MKTNRLASLLFFCISLFYVSNTNAQKSNYASLISAAVDKIEPKVITFHKKRRKGFSKKIGHRHALTKVKINSVA